MESINRALLRDMFYEGTQGKDGAGFAIALALLEVADELKDIGVTLNDVAGYVSDVATALDGITAAMPE
jgi:hypothetical protein